MTHAATLRRLHYGRQKVARQAVGDGDGADDGGDDDDGIPDDGGADDGFGEDPGFGDDSTDDDDDDAASTSRSAARSTSRASSRPAATSTRASVVLVTSTAQNTPEPSVAPTSVAPQVMAVPSTTSFVPFSYAPISRTYNTNLYYTPTMSPSASASAKASTGPALGTMVGMIGGGLVAVVCLAAGVGWWFRRANRRKNRFDREEFVRNSVAIHDGDFHEKPAMGSKNALALARANNGVLPSESPRPPTMVERRAPAAVSFRPGQTVDPNPFENDQYYNNTAPGHPADYNYDYSQSNNGGHYQQDHYDVNGGAGGIAAGYDGRSDGHQQYDQYYGTQGSNQYENDGRDQYNTNNQYLGNEYDQSAAVPGNGNSAGIGRSLSTTYSNLNPHNPSNGYSSHDAADRSGTPTDRNPQQTYFAPNPSSSGGTDTYGQDPRQQGQKGQQRSAYNNDDAYGGM